jgi:hypothetical protein
MGLANTNAYVYRTLKLSSKRSADQIAGLSAVQPSNRNASDVLALISCSASLARCLVEREVLRDPGLKSVDELLIHVLVIVRDVEADDALPSDFLAELLLQPIQMPLLHHEDQVGPTEVPGRDPDSGALLCADRADVVTTDPVEDRLGGEASKAILAADKKNFHITSARSVLSDSYYAAFPRQRQRAIAV